MELRNLGNSNLQVTPIIMGTWQAGKSMWADIEDRESIKAIRTAFDEGITTFDTAPIYGNGHSEQILTQALGDVRDQVVIATKVFANQMRYDQVIASCEQSLKDLKTDYIDLLQVHWPSGSFGSPIVPIEETMQALNTLKEHGKIRAIGVSNFSRDQLREATRHGRIDSLQPPYSLFWRHVEKDAMPYCIENNITILAYSPLAQGILTGKFSPQHQFAKKDHRKSHKLFQPEHAARVEKALERLRPLAIQKGVSMAQLALAWLINLPGTCAIAGARTAEQVIDNAQAQSVFLSVEEFNVLDEIGQSVTDYLDDDPVQWG